MEQAEIDKLPYEGDGHGHKLIAREGDRGPIQYGIDNQPWPRSAVEMAAKETNGFTVERNGKLEAWFSVAQLKPLYQCTTDEIISFLSEHRGLECAVKGIRFPGTK